MDNVRLLPGTTALEIRTSSDSVYVYFHDGDEDEEGEYTAGCRFTADQADDIARKLKHAAASVRSTFPIAGEDDWWTEEGEIKPNVETDLVVKMDATIPLRTTWTSQSLVDVVMEQYKPKCNFAALDRLAAKELPPEAYTRLRSGLDTLYVLAGQRLQVAAES